MGKFDRKNDLINFSYIKFVNKICKKLNMSVCVSIAMCITYGLFLTGHLGDSYEKFCLANEVKYFPYNYKNQEEMMDYLSKPGSVNMTARFDFLILFGFISNLAYILCTIFFKSHN